MAAEDIKALLRKLLALQKIDAEVYGSRREIKDQPIVLEGIKDKYEAKLARYHDLQKRAQDLERGRKAIELELKSKEQEIVRANAQLMTLKTNKEYQAKLFEIENMKADQSGFEESILKSFDETAKVTDEMTREKVVVDEAEKVYLAEKEKVEAALKVLQDEVAKFEGQRSAASEGVDKATMAMYERLLDNRNGLAMVPVVNGACGGCFMKQTEQMMNRLKMCEELVRCETCARIQYLEAEL